MPAARPGQPGKDPSGGGDSEAEHLAEHLRQLLRPPVVVVGVGNDLCGDDGAGSAVARRLARTIPWPVFDVASVPENFLMKIVAARPATVLVIDALAFGGPPGAVELFAPAELTGQGPGTHGPAPLVFLDLLRMIHPCLCLIVGIQPAGCEVGQGLSPVGASAVDAVCRAVALLAGRAEWTHLPAHGSTGAPA